MPSSCLPYVVVNMVGREDDDKRNSAELGTL